MEAQTLFRRLKSDAIRLRNKIDQCADPEKKKELLKRYVKLITLLQCRNLEIEVVETSVEIVVISRRP